MSSYCMTVLWRRRKSKVHYSLIFVLFVLHSVFFSFLRNWAPGSKNNNNSNNGAQRIFVIFNDCWAVLMGNLFAVRGNWCLHLYWLNFLWLHRYEVALMSVNISFSLTGLYCHGIPFKCTNHRLLWYTFIQTVSKIVATFFSFACFRFLIFHPFFQGVTDPICPYVWTPMVLLSAYANQ